METLMKMKLMKKKTNNSVKEILEVIKNSNTIGVISHKNPDGDNLGSTIAMVLGIRDNLNKNIFAIKVDEIPDHLTFLETIKNIKEVKEQPLDLLIYVDCGEINRPGVEGDAFRNLSKKTLNIDHHKTNDLFADYNFVFPEKSSTCEIVYDLLSKMKFKISKDVSEALLLGIITDTNRFLYENSSSSTLRIAADLYDLGANKNYIYKQLYQNNKLEVEMLKNKLINRAKFYFKNKVAIIGLFQSDFENTDLKMDMFDDLVNYYRDIQGFEVSIILKETEKNLFKASLRSKEYVDCSYICSKFNGGGHTRAAGCKIQGNFDQACQKITSLLEKEYFNGI